MTATATQPWIMVLGIGNILHGDDGVGIHVIKALDKFSLSWPLSQAVALRDGGTIGLALLPEIEDASALIVIDAAEFGAESGTVRVMHGAEMDAQLGGKKRTAHEVALADLMAAAELTGRRPERRALVAVQPASTEWRLTPTETVASAIPQACKAVLSLIEGWVDAI
jgi:hydrogenase maturation protease